MVYSVSCIQPKVQQPRLTRTLLVSVGFFEDMWIPLVHLPQPCALYVFLLHFPIQASRRSNYTAIPTNAHISGFRAPRQRLLTNSSILPRRSGCTSTKARLCAYVWREMSFAMMNRVRQKQPRVSSLVDKARHDVYRTL
jgi:hypothetical protein